MFYVSSSHAPVAAVGEAASHRQDEEGRVRPRVVEPPFVEGAFLGVGPTADAPDMIVVPLAYELTTSYGRGTADGPAACIEASGQVELYDAELGEDLPAGLSLHTAAVWESSMPTLLAQLDDMANHARRFMTGDVFPLFLGGEHGILPPLVHAARDHPRVNGDLSQLTLVQIDAHADLRSSLDGEPFSHACAAARALDVGAGRLLQAGIRAYAKEEAERMKADDRITSFLAKSTQHPHHGAAAWSAWLDELRLVEGPVHLTLDIDGLDGTLVPATGTPVPGGLSFWQVVETIEVLFANPKAVVISADVNEIAVQTDSPLTQFTAASLATRILAHHVLARREGRWTQVDARAVSDPALESFFQTTFGGKNSASS